MKNRKTKRTYMGDGNADWLEMNILFELEKISMNFDGH